jgi:hypothetical protein
VAPPELRVPMDAVQQFMDWLHSSRC